MKKIIIGNFKMNTLPREFKSYAMTLVTNCKGSQNKIVVCPPFTHLSLAENFFAGTNIEFGAQNLSAEQKGSLTGEISAEMLKDISCGYVIIGHSERRTKFKETDKVINKKITTALSKGLKVVLCVGESAQTRRLKDHNEFVKKQLDEALKGLYENELDSVIVAYEPIWAIGTGVVPTQKEIESMIDTIRSQIEQLYSKAAAEKISVLYGGSVNASNHKKLLASKKISGALIGGACLKADEFSIIANEKFA